MTKVLTAKLVAEVNDNYQHIILSFSNLGAEILIHNIVTLLQIFYAS